MSHAEPREVLGDKRADATKADDGDFASGQNLLTRSAEHAHLAVVLGERFRGGQRLRIESFDALANDSVGAESSSRAVRQPYVGGYRTLSEDQRAHRYAAPDVEKGGVTALVGLKVDPAEGNRTIASMVVDREIGKACVAALDDLPVDKRGAERAVAVLAGDVVAAEFGGFDMPDKESQRIAGANDAGVEDGAMFVVVAGIKMGHEPHVGFGGYKDIAGIVGH